MILCVCLFLMVGAGGTVFVLTRAHKDNNNVLLYEDFDDGSYSDAVPALWQVDWSHSGNPNGNPSIRDQDPLKIVCFDENCYLEGHTAKDPGRTQSVAFIYTDNLTNVGSWKFDSRLRTTGNNIYNSLILGTDSSPFDGNNYSISHREDSRIVFSKKVNGESIELLSQTGFGGQNDLWHTIELTRDVNGKWSVYFDTELIGSVVDNTITNFPVLLVGRYGHVDNVVVSSGE